MQIGLQEGLLERGGKVAFYRMSVHWPKLVYPAFPDWIPTTRSEPRTCARQVFSLLFNSSLLSQCQTTIYKAIFFVPNSSPKTLRNQIGNWLDWKQGLGSLFPHQKPLWWLGIAVMKTAPQGLSKWPVGFNRCLPMEWFLVTRNMCHGWKALPLTPKINCAIDKGSRHSGSSVETGECCRFPPGISVWPKCVRGASPEQYSAEAACEPVAGSSQPQSWPPETIFLSYPS